MISRFELVAAALCIFILFSAYVALDTALSIYLLLTLWMGLILAVAGLFRTDE